jgi:hypothetical protein
MKKGDALREKGVLLFAAFVEGECQGKEGLPGIKLALVQRHKAPASATMVHFNWISIH